MRSKFLSGVFSELLPFHGSRVLLIFRDYIDEKTAIFARNKMEFFEVRYCQGEAVEETLFQISPFNFLNIMRELVCRSVGKF